MLPPPCFPFLTSLDALSNGHPLLAPLLLILSLCRREQGKLRDQETAEGDIARNIMKNKVCVCVSVCVNV
jgi:hypothetical protein